MAFAVSSVSLTPRRFLCFHKPSASFNLEISHFTPQLSLNSPCSLHPPPSTKILPFQLFSTAQDISYGENSLLEIPQDNPTRLYVVNLPWTLSASDIKNIFSHSGSVNDVEVIMQKNGKSRGFAFVTMDTHEQAQAAIDKFNLSDLRGRTLRVEFAKSAKKSPSPPPESTEVKETSCKLYVSNLAWKVRSSHLREFFAASFKPLSAKVVLDNPSGRSAGYGFVSFTTKEEAEAAISALNEKELMGRPVRLKISERKLDESANEPEQTEQRTAAGRFIRV